MACLVPRLFVSVGDWMTISTYLLLIVLWTELMQHARQHFYSQIYMVGQRPVLALAGQSDAP